MPDQIVVRDGNNQPQTVDTHGTAISGQALEAVGHGPMGWLSSLRKAITDRLPAALVSGRLDVNIGASAVTQTVSGTVTANLGTISTAATETTVAAANTARGAISDAEAASGNGTLIALLKRLRTLLAGGLPAALVSGRLDVNIGASAVTQAVSGTVTANLGSAIPAGNNNIGDVDVLSLIPGTAATNLGKAIDSAAGATDTGVASLAVRKDALVTLTPADGDYVPLLTNNRGALYVAAAPWATGGLTTVQDIDLDEASPANIKNAAGKVHGWMFYNAHATAVRYIKLYNKASAPVLASDTPAITIPVPPASLAHVFTDLGIDFPLGIGWAATTGVANNDVGAPGANDVQATLFYF